MSAHPPKLRLLSSMLLLALGQGALGAAGGTVPDDGTAAGTTSPTAAGSSVGDPPSSSPNFLHPIVVTGTRVPHDPMDVAASVGVVERSDIVTGKSRVDITEDLAGIAGIQALNRYDYAQDLQISSRGFGAQSPFGTRSIKLYTDGIPATMADGQGETSTFNLDQAQRIEVLQGPMSAVYGNSAGGVIQLFTRDGSGPTTIDASMEGGSYNTWKDDVDALGAESGVGYLVDSSHFHTDGFRPDSKANRDQQMAKLTLNPTDGGKLTFLMNALQQHDTQDPMGLSASEFQSNPFGPINATQVQSNPGGKPFFHNYTDLAAAYGTRKSLIHDQAGINFDQSFGTDHLQLTIYTGNRQVTQFQSSTASFISNAGVVDFSRNFYGADARWIAVRQLGENNKLTFTAGINNDSFQDDRRGYTNFTTGLGAGSSLNCGTTATCGVFGNENRIETDTVRSTDPYVQAEWALNRWMLTGGLRYSRVSFNVANNMSAGLTSAAATAAASGNLVYTHTTPMVSALYKLNSRTNYYISASEGFETPTMDELFYSPNGSTGVSNKFNFNLKAATIRYYETGLKSLLNDDTTSTFALYHIISDNEAVVDVNYYGATAYQNAQTERNGAEWNLASQLTPTLRGQMAVTLIHAYFPNNGSVANANVLQPITAGNRIPGVADKSAYAELAWTPVHYLETAAEFTTQDHMYVDLTNNAMPAPGYATMNWRVMAHQEADGWKFKEFARVDNLFNRLYAGSVIVGDAFGRYYQTAPGRNVMLGASASYTF